MEYSGEGVQALVCVLDDLENSNLIFIDKKVSEVLKCLAYYEEFRNVLTYCNTNFDYEQEKKRAIGKLGDQDFLKLSRNPKNLVAFVTSLLVEIETKSQDIVLFANKFFPAETKQESFAIFFKQVLEPFKFAIVKMVVEGYEEEKVDISKDITLANEGLQQQTQYLLVSIFNTVKEASLDDDDRADFKIMLEGFAAAMDSRDTLMIKSTWTGLKRSLINKKFCANEIKKMEEALKLYMVTK